MFVCLVILVEIFDAMDVVGSVHGKRNAIQTPMADHTGEALGMIGLPSRPQDTLHYGLTTYVAGLQGVLKSNAEKQRSYITYKLSQSKLWGKKSTEIDSYQHII